QDVAAGVAKQLKKFALVSTADHHGPIDHPFFVNANIISALPYRELNDVDLRYLIVFSFASVSANNSSAYPRGILFHGDNGGEKELLRLPLLPDKIKMGVVYASRGYTRDDISNAIREIRKKRSRGLLTNERTEAISTLIETHFGASDILGFSELAPQITKINYRLWPLLFHPHRSLPWSPTASAVDANVPNLVYLEIETIVKELLMRKHLQSPESLIYRLLFSPEYRTRASTYFNNIPGAFSTDHDWGTFFFWGLNDKLHRKRLLLERDTLVNHDAGLQVPFTPLAIEEALKTKRIFPSMLLCYLMVSQYYGIKCLGGFSQVNDLTMTKNAWQRLLRDVGEDSEADAVESTQTKELGGDGIVLSYLAESGGGLAPATGIDMILENVDTRFDEYVSLSHKVTLEELMQPMLPEMYSVLYSAAQRDPRLMIPPETIVKGLHLDNLLVKKRILQSAKTDSVRSELTPAIS
ncbi:MAG: hypothetical protein V1685_06675, partial [Parcubacteria group bacterium]